MTKPAQLSPRRLPATSAGFVPATPETGQRPPFGWPCFALTDQPVTLHFAGQPKGGAALRIAVAIDLRTPAVVEVRSAHTEETWGSINLSFGTVAQIGELALSAEQTRLAIKHGLTLHRSDAPEPIYLLAPGRTAQPFVPHLLEPDDAPPLARLAGVLRDPHATLTQFGWMAMCVLDAQLDLGFVEAADHQLSHYFDRDGPVYEDNYSFPKDGIVSDSERTGIYAALAKRQPDHPGIDKVLDFFREQTREDGTVRTHSIVAEHHYTVAYPMAVIGRQRNDPALIRAAARQLRVGRDNLRHEGALWLRRSPEGKLSYRGWSRGVAWYLLGAARTLRVLADQPGLEDLQQDLAGGCRWALSHQRPDGLWGSYLEEQATAPETSGSAGIAAAVAIAASQGWLDARTQEAAQLTQRGLETHVSGDGLLGGMSQSNKGEAGEDVQRSPFRVLGPCATGMAGQLIAALSV